MCMEGGEHHVCGIQRVDKVGRHGALLFPGVRGIVGVPPDRHIQTLKSGLHLHNHHILCGICIIDCVLSSLK